jgi:hypothetical protein
VVSGIEDVLQIFFEITETSRSLGRESIHRPPWTSPTGPQ